MNTMTGAFSIARLPRIEFGRGVISRLPGLLATYGERVLLVTGGGSFTDSPAWTAMREAMDARGMVWRVVRVNGEPSPRLIDEAVAEQSAFEAQVVAGIGGGSALDAAKAIAGLARVGRSVMDYLEGVGPELSYEGPALPFIAVPTTAGTGSEATKNAVLSRQGGEGFKKSFRDDKLVAEYALLDPDLLASCPPALIAANGMDALTQLMESYVSTRGNRFCDDLGVGALRALRDGMLYWYQHAGQPELTHEARAAMHYAACVSGINLAQTGLGSVHGVASPMGAFFPIPHGTVCGTLVAKATEINIEAMLAREPRNPALARYARLGEILCARRFSDADAARHALLERLYDWSEAMALPRLHEFGMREQDIPRVVAGSRGSSMKTNPIHLHDEEIAALLAARL